MTDLRVRSGVTVARLAAALAVAATALGALLIATAVVATPRLWLGGYVSEAGVASSGHAELYGLGAAGLAGGQALFAVALSFVSAPPLTSIVDRTPGWLAERVVPLAVGLLAVDAAFGAVSAAVPCSPGCPLPPHETPTATDLVHGGASVLAVGLMSLAMLTLALLRPPSVLAGPSRVAALAVVPLVAVDGLAILIVGRGYLTGMLERAVLLGAVAWTLTVCWRLSSARSLTF